ncbi:helix-turn-helix transcriptional regulator [Amycolatopsis magusensis]|uniref:helix-turn-helix transcriptional regulator n=1 Tax=Amycolatopsis magusensis TaxID=882444 RepID=UPI003C2B2767
MAAKRRDLFRQRRAVGLSQEKLADALGVERTTVIRWENGESEPQPWIRRKLANQLAVSVTELEVLLQSREDADSGGPNSIALGDPGKADLTTVAALRLELQQVEAEYDSKPSTGLLAIASQHLGRTSFLRANVVSRRLRRDLWALEAESATLMGQLVWDASQRRDHEGPRHYFDQAIDAARQINDAPGEAYATLRRSYLALYGDKPAAGLIDAQAAAAVGRTSAALTGLSLLHVAEAHAMLGNRRDCEKSLDAAVEQLDQVGDADPAGDYLSSTEVERLSGSCYLFLDLPKQAEGALRKAAHQLANKRKSQAIVLGNLSLAYIRQGELTGAVEALHQTIDALEGTRGGGGLNLAFSAGRELREWRHEQSVQELNDRLFDLMVVS